MPTQREMAEAYIEHVEREADALIAKGMGLKQHAAECRDQLANDDKPAEPAKPVSRKRKR